MKEGWTYKKLGEVCELIMGQSPESTSYNKEGDGLPFFQGCSDFGALNPNVTTYCSAPLKIAEPLDVLMSVRAPVGTLNIANVKCCIGRGLASFRQIEGLSVYKFLYYLLKSAQPIFQQNSTGATFKAIGKSFITNYKIEYPPFIVQKQIVSELDLLSDVIEKKKTQIEELNNLAQSTFYDMFGDPVINEKGWSISKYGDEFKIGSGGTPSKSNPEYWEGGDIPWIGSNMCQNCVVYDNDGKYITEKGLRGSSANILKVGTVLIALVGATIGKVALLQKEMATNQNIANINVWDNNNFEPIFIFYHSMNLYHLFIKLGDGGFKMANQSFIRELPLILPPLALQQEFAAKIEDIEQMKAKVRQSLKESEELFNSRMDYYFN